MTRRTPYPFILFCVNAMLRPHCLTEHDCIGLPERLALLHAVALAYIRAYRSCSFVTSTVRGMAGGLVQTFPGRARVKTYDIEVQRLKSTKHDKGMIELGVDVLVLPLPVRDEQSATSRLRLPVDHARSLLILLKQQLAEVDKLQPRSRRSGRS
jgi:hypothetical protein